MQSDDIPVTAASIAAAKAAQAAEREAIRKACGVEFSDDGRILIQRQKRRDVDASRR